MAVSYVASSATDTSPFSADRTGVTFPAGTTTDDVIIVSFTTPNAHTLNTTTGWTQIGTTQTTATTLCTTSILYRVVDGTEGGSWDFTGIFTTAESGGVYMATYRGVDTADVIEANAETTTGSVTSVSGPSVTPVNDNCMILQILGGETATTGGAADTSPVANLRNNDDVSGGSGHSYTFHQDYLQSTAAALALDATSLTSTEYTAFQVALNEGAASPEVGTVDTDDTFTSDQTSISGAYSNFTTAPDEGRLYSGSFESSMTNFSAGGGTFTFDPFDATSITVDTAGVPYTSASWAVTLEITSTDEDPDEVASKVVTFNPPATWSSVVEMSGAVATNLLYLEFHSSGEIPDTSQVIHDDPGNTTIGTDSAITQTVARNFNARVFDATTGTWEPIFVQLIASPSGGKKSIRSAVSEVVRSAIRNSVR